MKLLACKDLHVACLALVGCISVSAAPAEGERATLSSLYGTKKQNELLRRPEVQHSLSQVTGQDYKRVMSILNQPDGSINLVEGHLQFSGHIPDLPEVEAVVACMNLSDYSAHLLLIDGNARTLYSKTRVYNHLPLCIRTAILIDYHSQELDSPPAQGGSEYRLQFK